jgi:hypothetical protein
MMRSSARYLPGLVLVGLAGVLYSRAGYGPFGDAEQRAKPCTFTRCAHNASLVLVGGTGLLLKAARTSG